MSQKSFNKEVTFEQGLERQVGIVQERKSSLHKSNACVTRGAYARCGVWASVRSSKWQEAMLGGCSVEELLRTTLKL